MKLGFSLAFLLLFVCTSFGQVQTGKASFYANKFSGRMTASGEKYRPNKFTAAHRHLPFGTMVRVTNLANNKSVVVKVNDRGPFVSSRIIDLSRVAAEKLDFIANGTTDVVVKVVDGKNDHRLASTNEPKKTVETENKEKPGSTTEVPAKELETEFYELSVGRTKPEGFGVQIGSFQEADNLIRFADNLKASYKKKVTVQLKTVENTKIYSLILGTFSTRKKAENFEEKVAKKYPDCFVVSYSESAD